MSGKTDDALKSLFEPYNGENIQRMADGRYVIWTPYANHSPIVVDDEELAKQIERALSDAYSAGLGTGSYTE